MMENWEKLLDNKAYYDLLGVSPDVDESSLKKKYRKLALEYHPDKNPEGTEEFQKIAKAYKILSDTSLREIYDQYGEGGIQRKEFYENNENITAFVLKQWGILVAVWLGAWGMDWFFGTILEWYVHRVFPLSGLDKVT